ncbi:hypothetical protein L202_04530 [Cryptococcus amylolentus CBS 6039]|uniref:methionyl-tRNA formyltransferase n=1 Tax=Cryptococcus amylolentus CBS 6039 TaxID=1295533 RepID=A0A1E3HSA0_9TREE|nr:hypothetical protein L202_04530 [Cryptococcus amylolentus CBS 6039]ODN79025.1 hypothetical protein L202_04530 [Cryptococcus amylolentus CBS 6039]
MLPAASLPTVRLAKSTLHRGTRASSWRLFSASCASRKEEPFRILFCGSDDFSVASLEAIHNAKDLWSSIDVVVPAERQVGRGGRHAQHHTYTPALRQYAEKHNLPLSTVPSPGLKSWSPPSHFLPSPSSPTPEPVKKNVLLTASFGHIIPSPLLALFAPTHRLNVHPSLLPRWRGAAPVQWTIAKGDEKTGVSVQGLVEYSRGVDAGDIVGRVYGVPVPKNATYNSLLPHLALIGGDLLVDVLRQLKAGTATFTPQNPSHITQAPKITSLTAHLRFPDQTAVEIDRLHRGVGGQVPLWTTLGGEGGTSVQLLSVAPVAPVGAPVLSLPLDPTPGIAVLHKEKKERKLFVACKSGTWLQVHTLKTAGKKALSVGEWWNGLPRDVREGGGLRFG